MASFTLLGPALRYFRQLFVVFLKKKKKKKGFAESIYGYLRSKKQQQQKMFSRHLPYVPENSL